MKRRKVRALVEQPDLSGPYERVVSRGFSIASKYGQSCSPIHLLAALSEVDGAIGLALTPTGGGDLLARPPNPAGVSGSLSSYVTLQTQQAARQFAGSRAEASSPAHLLVAIIDQADSEAMRLLTTAGIDPAQLRRVALKELGASLDLPRIEMPPLAPAGLMERPILSESELDLTAWQILRWRQSHLPLGALRNERDWRRLCNLEIEAAGRLYQRLRLPPDQEASLRVHHVQRVQQLAHDARPDLVLPPFRPHSESPAIGMVVGDIGLPIHRQPRALRFTAAWGTWFNGRWAAIVRWSEWIQIRRFAFRTRASYRGVPKTTDRPR